MFNKDDEKDIYDGEVLRVITELSLLKPDSKEYTEAVKNLHILQQSRFEKKKHGLSSDAILAAAGNLTGILLVLNFEKLGVITSKAFSLVTKIRV